MQQASLQQASLQQASLLQTQSNQKYKGAPDTNPIEGGFATGFITSNIIKSIVQRRTRYEPDHRVLFYYVGNIACDISGITTKAPCEAVRMGGAPCAHRNFRFRAAHFSPLFQHHTISSPVSCRKTLFVTAFLKKDKSISFPFRCLSKIVEKFLFIVPYYPLHFLLVCFRIVLQNLYER